MAVPRQWSKPTSHSSTDVVLSSGRVTVALTVVVTALLVASLCGQVSAYFLGHGTLYGVVPLVNVGIEANLPTWYSSLALLFCSALLALIAVRIQKVAGPFWRHWAGLAAIFLMLAADEAAAIHELLNQPLERFVQPSGLLLYPWVVAGAAFALIVGVAYLRFMLALPGRTRHQFLFAAAIYLGGALAMEMAGARHAWLHGKKNFSYELYRTAEEGLEMVGIVVFIHALLAYLSSGAAQFRILFGESPVSASSSAGAPDPSGAVWRAYASKSAAALSNSQRATSARRVVRPARRGPSHGSATKTRGDGSNAWTTRDKTSAALSAQSVTAGCHQRISSRALRAMSATSSREYPRPRAVGIQPHQVGSGGEFYAGRFPDVLDVSRECLVVSLAVLARFERRGLPGLARRVRAVGKVHCVPARCGHELPRVINDADHTAGTRRRAYLLEHGVEVGSASNSEQWNAEQWNRRTTDLRPAFRCSAFHCSTFRVRYAQEFPGWP